MQPTTERLRERGLSQDSEKTFCPGREPSSSEVCPQQSPAATFPVPQGRAGCSRLRILGGRSSLSPGQHQAAGFQVTHSRGWQVGAGSGWEARLCLALGFHPCRAVMSARASRLAPSRLRGEEQVVPLPPGTFLGSHRRPVQAAGLPDIPVACSLSFFGTMNTPGRFPFFPPRCENHNRPF